MQILRRFTLYKRGSVRGSNQCHAKSSVAAAVSSDPSPVRRRGRKVPKDERRGMVEAFVIKYRDMNSGKYPPTKATVKEVGGSYYVIKNILQELQYNSKMHAKHKEIVVQGALAEEAATSKDHLLAKVEKSLSSARVIEHADGENGQLKDRILLETESIQRRKPSPELKEILSNRRSSDVEDGDDNCKLEANAKVQTSNAAELEMPNRELSGDHNVDAQAERKSSMWSNLKSLADGILNMWKKL